MSLRLLVRVRHALGTDLTQRCPDDNQWDVLSLIRVRVGILVRMEYQLAAGMAVLERTPAVLRAMLAGLPSQWIYATEGPDTWSPYVIVGHLVHSERADWVVRARMILEQGNGGRSRSLMVCAVSGE